MSTSTLAPVKFLELEITGNCPLRCTHCYASSGPQEQHSPLTVAQWESIIDQAAAADITAVQFIGGEPTVHPDLPRLIRHALSRDLRVQIYTNLLHISEELWELFTMPGVSLGTSWYSADPQEHAAIVGGSTNAWRRTRANIARAVELGIPLQVGIVKVRPDQDVEGAVADLQALGVTNINTDAARPVGRAAPHGRDPQTVDLCGRCGDGRAAIGPDGTVTPCVLGRFLPTGNVTQQSLAEIFSGFAWAEALAAVPRSGGPVCPPADSNDCMPALRDR